MENDIANNIIYQIKISGLLDERWTGWFNQMQITTEMIGNGNPYGDGRASERIIQAIKYYFGLGDRPGDFIPTSNPRVEAKGLRLKA